MPRYEFIEKFILPLQSVSSIMFHCMNTGVCVEGGLRLVGGSSRSQGRVEICIGQVWGTVCDDFWGTSDAQVVCRQLGFSTDGEILKRISNTSLMIYCYSANSGATAHSFSAFGQGTGPIFLDNVQCAGTESTLLACTHITNHNCIHLEDAGVTCQGGTAHAHIDIFMASIIPMSNH